MEKKWLHSLTFASEGEEITDQDGRMREVIACAEALGMTLLEGSVDRSRERDPIETLRYGSTHPWRNGRAEEQMQQTSGGHTATEAAVH